MFVEIFTSFAAVLEKISDKMAVGKMSSQAAWWNVLGRSVSMYAWKGADFLRNLCSTIAQFVWQKFEVGFEICLFCIVFIIR